MEYEYNTQIQVVHVQCEYQLLQVFVSSAEKESKKKVDGKCVDVRCVCVCVSVLFALTATRLHKITNSHTNAPFLIPSTLSHSTGR